MELKAFIDFLHREEQELPAPVVQTSLQLVHHLPYSEESRGSHSTQGCKNAQAPH